MKSEIVQNEASSEYIRAPYTGKTHAKYQRIQHGRIQELYRTPQPMSKEMPKMWIKL